jgi:hypothetical protein
MRWSRRCGELCGLRSAKQAAVGILKLHQNGFDSTLDIATGRYDTLEFGCMFLNQKGRSSF